MIKKKELEDAIDTIRGDGSGKKSVQMRVDYYNSLLEGGLFATEHLQLAGKDEIRCY